MATSLAKIRKIRSLDEIVTRSGQALSIYREQRRGGHVLPDDDEFTRLVDAIQFGTSPIIAESLWQKFYKNGRENFFPAFKNVESAGPAYELAFGNDRAKDIISCADNIANGRIHLLGLRNLYVGQEIDWHREPVSLKRSPLKHWKEFDDLDCSETGNKKILWELNRHQHFFTLGAAYLLTGNEEYAKVFARHIESWMDTNPPGLGINWSSSLEVSFRAISWIWAFHFFEHSDSLTPSLFKRALKYLFLHGKHIESYLSKYYSPNTHLTGEALGLYYLGTQMPFFSRANHWRELGEDILLSEITRQILPDGVYFEQSTWYQRYTLDIYSHYIVLRSLRGGPNLTRAAAELEARLEKGFDFLLQVTMPDGTTPLIGDDDGGRMLPLTGNRPDDFRGTLALGAAIMDKPEYRSVLSGSEYEEVFWLLGSKAVDGVRTQRAEYIDHSSKAFEAGGYYVMRDGGSDTDNVLVVDCGELGSLSGGHGHADALSIQVAMHGRPTFIDAGTYTYHEAPEIRNHFRSSGAHNTVEVDEFSSSECGHQFGWNTKAVADLDKWVSEPRFDLFEGRHNGYQRLADPVTHGRSVLFLKGDYWIIRDVLETQGEHAASINFHYDPSIKPLAGPENAWIGDERHRMFTFGDNGEWQLKESWISKNHGCRQNSSLARFVASGVGTQEFFTFLIPIAVCDEPPDVIERSTNIGRAFLIRYKGYTDLFLFNDQQTSVNNGLFSSDFRYTWARLREGERVPDEFVLIDGGSLIVQDRQIFEPDELSYASARRFGDDLYIKTDLGHFIRSLSSN